MSTGCGGAFLWKRGDYGILAVPSTLSGRREVCGVHIILSFLISVAASVAAHYICKWLDGDDDGTA